MNDWTPVFTCSAQECVVTVCMCHRNLPSLYCTTVQYILANISRTRTGADRAILRVVRGKKTFSLIIFKVTLPDTQLVIKSNLLFLMFLVRIIYTLRSIVDNKKSTHTHTLSLSLSPLYYITSSFTVLYTLLLLSSRCH